MTKKFIAIALLASAALQVSAAERSETQIRQAAAAALAKMPSAMHKVRSAQPLRILAKNTQLTVVGYENGGFAIVANDDQFKPVFGYSETQFTTNNNPGFDWYMTTLNASLERAKQQGRKLEEAKPSPEYAASVGELLTTRWGQDTPYNNMTPLYTDKKTGEKKHYVTGCVSTAMSMILHYFKYPVHGEGDIIYDFAPGSGEPSQTLEADFSNTTYQWDKMLNEYKDGSYTEEQANAVATIMKHCGYAVRMQYTISGSGAFIYESCRALREYFGFNKHIKCYNRSFFNVDEWMNIVYRELNDKCPVLYGGQSNTTGGHCFILDGYNEEGDVHVNWGWNGDQNGYFDIAGLNGFSDGQQMVEMRTATDTRYQGSVRSLICMSGKLDMTYDEKSITASLDGYLINTDIDPFSGYIQLIAINRKTGKAYLIKKGQRLDGQKTSEGFWIDDITGSVAALPAGEYRVFLAAKDDDETTWQPIRSHEVNHNSYILVINEDREIESLELDSDSSWTGIESVVTSGNTTPAVRGVYSLDGRYLGNDVSKLGKGLYIVNGEKVVK